MITKTSGLLSDHIANLLIMFIVGDCFIAMAVSATADWKLRTLYCFIAAVCAAIFGKSSLDAYRAARLSIGGWSR